MAPPPRHPIPEPPGKSVPPPSPIPPPAPSKTGAVTMPNDARCGYCKRWLLQGTPGVLCSCGKYYHEACARIETKCHHCGKKL